MLAHELTHAAIRELSRDRAPGWLHEGLAEWCEGRRALQQDLRDVCARHAPLALRDLETRFARADLEAARASYAEALGLVEFLLEQRGPGAIRCVLADLSADATIDSALSAEMGWDSSALLDAWVRWAGLKVSSPSAPR